MNLDLEEWEAPKGYTQAQWELTRLQFRHLEPGKSRPRDPTVSAQRLVEFRCRAGGAGHLLAVIYKSRRGPLAVSTADELHDAEWMAERRRRGQKRPNWAPSPKLIEFDEPFAEEPMPINCRCRRWPDLTREHLRVALACHASLGSSARPTVIGVSAEGLHSARDTLCLF